MFKKLLAAALALCLCAVPQPSVEAKGAGSLKAQVGQITEQAGGEWSVCYRDLGGGASFTMGGRPMVAASLIKLYVYGAAKEESEAGRLPVSCEGLFGPMISASDNAACNQLIDAVGFEKINSFIQRNGFRDTVLNRKMLAQG